MITISESAAPIKWRQHFKGLAKGKSFMVSLGDKQQRQRIASLRALSGYYGRVLDRRFSCQYVKDENRVQVWRIE